MSTVRIEVFLRSVSEGVALALKRAAVQMEAVAVLIRLAKSQARMQQHFSMLDGDE